MSRVTEFALALTLAPLPFFIGCAGEPADGGTPQARVTAPSDSGRAERLPELVKDALEKAEVFELLSIQPGPLRQDAEGTFHGYPVLGKTRVEGADTRRQLIGALERGVAEHDGLASGCFNPRHGIRAMRGTEVVDLVICFECFAVSVYVDGERRSGFPTSDSPQPVFDRVLSDAKVSLAPKAEG